MQGGIIQGFMLGLANGTSCLAFFAPVLLPYLLDEGSTESGFAIPDKEKT